LPVAIVAVSWLVFIAVIFLFPAAPTVNSHAMSYTAVVLFGWIGFSLVMYYFPVCGGVHTFEGPRANIRIEEHSTEETESSSSKDEE